MQRIERPQKTRISFPWAHYVRSFSYVAFFVYLAFLPITVISFTTALPLSIREVILVGVATLGLLSGGYALLRGKDTPIHVPYFFSAFILFILSLGLSTWLHGRGLEGYIGISIDAGTIIGIATPAVFLGLFLWAQPQMRALYRFALGGGMVVVALSGIVLIQGFSSTVSRLPSTPGDIVPIAGMVLLAAIVLLHGARTFKQYACAAVVMVSALMTLASVGAPRAVWIAVVIVTGVYTFRYVRTLLFQAMHSATRHVEHLLGHMRMHWVSNAVAGVFFIAVAMASIAPLREAVIASAFEQNTKDATASLSETKAMLRSMFSEAPLLGGGLGSFQDAWRREGFAVTLLSTPPTQAQSTITTWFLAGGMCAGMWLLLGVFSFLSAGIRVRYLPHFYDRGWYLAAHASWVAGAFGLYYICVSSIGMTALVCMMVSIGIFFTAHRHLIGETEGVLQVAATRWVRRSMGIFCLALACVVLYGMVQYVRAVRFETDALSAHTRIPLVEFFSADIDNRIAVIDQMAGDQAYTDALLTEMRAGTARLLEALSEYPHDLSLNERAVVWFSLLGSLGVDGSYVRAETYARVLTEYVPHSQAYAIAHAELLVYLNRKEEAQEIVGQAWLHDNNEARRVRINMLLAEENFDAIQKELDASASLRASSYGQLLYAALMIHNGAYTDAVTYLDRFITTFPEIAEGYILRAHLYRLEGDNNSVRRILEQGVAAVHSGNRMVLRALLAALPLARTIDETTPSIRAGKSPKTNPN